MSREFYEPKFEIDPRFLWREFVKRAGGHPQVADDGFTILTKLYGEPHRAYHTMAHISWCLDLLREAFPEGSRTSSVSAAMGPCCWRPAAGRWNRASWC